MTNRNADPLRAGTLNVWGRKGDWPARRSVLTAGLARLRPDLIALQETIVDSNSDQAKQILGPDYYIVHQQSRDHSGMGVTIASRWPIIRTEEIDLHLSPRTGTFPCATLLAEVDAPEPYGPILFANHFPSFQLPLEYEREIQAVAAARAIHDLVEGRDLHVIVAGDLDADPAATSMRLWTGRQSLDNTSVCYRDAWAAAHPHEDGHTFTPENPLHADWDWPFRRIDYVLVRCADHGGPTLVISSCDRIFDTAQDGVWASDHFGVLAELVPPPGTDGRRRP